MKEEIESIEKNKTQHLIDLSKRKLSILAKWIYNTKTSPLSEILKLKARVFARENKQIEGLDYFDTFTSILHYSRICTILALVTQKQWYIRQIDFKTTFLNGILEGEIFMEVQESFY